ncbi:MAG: 2-amino-4-hydroxy-6-hydroxymethyldihydropteridine diphosphokinase [Bacteroidetes bacterium]|nr:2-amino-4-hydroxy-6-hydroxymethyldihydropteridine diphosphokinase [Bacteroidota bacterium]MBU1719978.1 2-amino-4-hydroxy-6-hydroxymethyldihydropteridine diphosphokinase [Bacteroidota bacterium]
MPEVILLTGTNIPPKFENIVNAGDYIGSSIGDIVTTSEIFESKPWGFVHDSSFLNQIIICTTNFTPEELLQRCMEYETNCGRKPKQSDNYEARVIDIDILFYDDLVYKSQTLEVPHPRLHLRKFTLIPLCSVRGDKIHPVFSISIKELLDQCEDTENPAVYLPRENESDFHGNI